MDLFLFLLIASQAWWILEKMDAWFSVLFKGFSWGGEVTSDGLWDMEKKYSECGTIFEWLNTVGVLTLDGLSHRESELVDPVRGKQSLVYPHQPRDWWLSCRGSSPLIASAASPKLKSFRKHFFSNLWSTKEKLGSWCEEFIEGLSLGVQLYSRMALALGICTGWCAKRDCGEAELSWDHSEDSHVCLRPFSDSL